MDGTSAAGRKPLDIPVERIGNASRRTCCCRPTRRRIAITTVADGTYQDAFGPALLRYRYRGSDPNHRDNAGLRELIDREPLVYFHALIKGKYRAVWPVFVVNDDPSVADSLGCSGRRIRA
jgi:hypothetical protein